MLKRKMKYYKNNVFSHYWSEFGVRGGVVYPHMPYKEWKGTTNSAEPKSGDDHLRSSTK